jgi:hypothetical protein
MAAVHVKTVRHIDARNMWMCDSPDTISDKDLWRAKIRTADNFVVLARWHIITAGTISTVHNEVS